MNEPIRIQEWINNYGKWLHFRLQPPIDSHVVTLNRCDGKLPWKGVLYPSAEGIDFASDARLVDVQYDEPDPEAALIDPEFKGGRFCITLQLPTQEGLVFNAGGERRE